MSKKDKKTYTTEEAAAEIYKSVYKSILKTIRNSPKKAKVADSITEDILDENYTAEIDPDDIPHEKESIVNKSLKKKRGVPKGVSPDKHERCVKDVKGQGHDKESAIRICNDSLRGKTKKSLDKSIDSVKSFRMKKIQKHTRKK